MAKSTRKPRPAVVPPAVVPPAVVPPTLPITTGMYTKKNVISGAVVVALIVIGLIVWGAIAFWPKSVTRFSGQNRQNGVILGVGQEDLERTMADNYDFGMEEGLNRSGVCTISLDELRDIADEGIRRYSRYVGDPKYREEQEELDRKSLEKERGAPPKPTAKTPPTSVKK